MSTILLIEDDITSREMLVHKLLSCGYQVLQAGCAADAEEIILCWLPDLMLLDITLPDKSGMEALKVIQKQQLYLLSSFPKERLTMI